VVGYCVFPFFSPHVSFFSGRGVMGVFFRQRTDFPLVSRGRGMLLGPSA